MRKKIIRVGRVVSYIVVIKVLFIIALFVLFALYTNVPTAYTEQDKAIFENKLHLASFRNPGTLAQEIKAITTIQHETFSSSIVGQAIPDYEVREPAEFFGKREGLCFDRSRTTDKALKYIGLQSRHVYLLYRESGRGFWSSMLHYRHPSHAVTEVKTSKGWMLVDSNTNWIALTRDGQVVGADDVWKRSAEFETCPSYLKHPWWALRGVYSRKGQLYPPFLLFPNINWYDLISWLFFG